MTEESTGVGICADMKPTYNMSFHNAEKTVGTLDWGDGVLKFTGDAAESAKLLFGFLKPLMDHYLKKEDKMAEIVVAEGTSTIHCAIMMDRSEEARKVISEWLPFKYPMPCGELYTLLSITDLPESDLPCICGDSTHWFVKYMK